MLIIVTVAAEGLNPWLSCRFIQRYLRVLNGLTHPSCQVEPEGAPGHLIIVVGAGVVLAVVLQALQLAGHVGSRVRQPKLQHLLGVLDQLLSILWLCKRLRGDISDGTADLHCSLTI